MTTTPEPEPELIDDCEAYLTSLHCTLWSDFYLTDPERKRQAATWLARQIEGVYAVQEANRPFYATVTPRLAEPEPMPNPHVSGTVIGIPQVASSDVLDRHPVL